MLEWMCWQAWILLSNESAENHEVSIAIVLQPYQEEAVTH